MNPNTPTDATGCRVLVVEDDATIAANVIDYLAAFGFEPDAAHDGPAALVRLGRETYDVLVLDIGLPRIDGLDVLRALRTRLGLTLPVLLLTARDTEADKIDGFTAGADDYLVKPFSLAELRLRLQALHRRARGLAVEPEILRAGALKLDLRARQASVDGSPLHLAPRTMKLLELLMRDPGRVVTRAELESGLWPDDLPEGDALRSQVHLLRRALQGAGCEALDTVHGVGWRLRP